MFDPDTMRARFHDLGRQRDEILARSQPLRDKRETAVQLYESVVKPLEAEIKEIEKPLFAIDQERAIISRALAGKTGAA